MRWADQGCYAIAIAVLVLLAASAVCQDGGLPPPKRGPRNKSDAAPRLDTPGDSQAPESGSMGSPATAHHP